MTNIIVLEGVDGSGKTTLAKNLKEILSENGYSCQIFREPDEFKDIINKPK
jgi:thymidylate kinase